MHLTFIYFTPESPEKIKFSYVAFHTYLIFYIDTDTLGPIIYDNQSMATT